MRGRPGAQQDTARGSRTERSGAARAAMAGSRPAPGGSPGIPPVRPAPLLRPDRRPGETPPGRGWAGAGSRGRGRRDTDGHRSRAEPVCPGGSAER